MIYIRDFLSLFPPPSLSSVCEFIVFLYGQYRIISWPLMQINKITKKQHVSHFFLMLANAIFIETILVIVCSTLHWDLPMNTHADLIPSPFEIVKRIHYCVVVLIKVITNKY